MRERSDAPGVAAGYLLGALAGLAVVALAWDDSDLGSPDHRWAIAAVIGTGAVVGWALRPVSRLLPRAGSFPLVLTPVLAAVYACVPETDQVRPLAAAVGVSLLVELFARAPLPWWWHGVLAWLVLWGAVYGATGRQSAIVGGLFAWWPLVLPLAVALAVPGMASRSEVVPWSIVVIGAVAAVAVARTGGLDRELVPAVRAVAVAAPASFAASLALAAIARWLSARRERRPS